MCEKCEPARILAAKIAKEMNQEKIPSDSQCADCLETYCEGNCGCDKCEA